MPTLPDRADLQHLKKQAKALLRRYRSGEADAIAQLARVLPFAVARTGDASGARPIRLHDAQSCIARDYGFRSWPDLASYVEAQALAREDGAGRLRRWLGLVYGSAVTGSSEISRPRVAARLLDEVTDLVATDPYAACAAGDEAILRRTVAADPGWVNRAGGPFKLPPLVAVTHSGLGELPAFRDRLHRSARLLLEAGADPNQTIGTRYPPASLATPDDKTLLSALYGAAGVVRDPEMTRLLLEAGADPNDNESLYHSVENPDCTRLLLKYGARISGSNALGRSFDMPTADALVLLLAHGGDANEVGGGSILTGWGPPLLRAIAVRRSPAHIRALLDAGADPFARTPAGTSAYRLALQAGLQEVADLLKAAGAAEPLSLEEAFVAACARADAEAARRIQRERPDLPGSLPATQLRLMPDTIAWGSNPDAAARVMVELGWPIATPGGDWKASALNLAVFRGAASMVDFLLGHGASWQETHGHGDNVLGTLSWSSLNEPNGGGGGDGDWAGCARALLRHGLPTPERDPADPARVLIAGRSARFSEDVTAVLLGSEDAN